MFKFQKEVENSKIFALINVSTSLLLLHCAYIQHASCHTLSPDSIQIIPAPTITVALPAGTVY